MLWSNEDIAKLREMLVKHPSRSAVQITRAMGLGYNVDDVAGVCGAILMKGDNDMSANRIDPVEFWKMVDAGTPTREIAKHFGVAQTSVCHKIAKGRPKAAVLNANNKDKENNDMKWTPDKTEQLLIMKAEGCSNTEIAEALGFPPQTVHNKVCDLKKLNGGVLPAKYTGKRKYTVADVTPYKPDASDDIEETPTDTPAETVDTPTETPPKRPCKVDFDVILDSVDAGKPMPEKKAETVPDVPDAVETVTDTVETVTDTVETVTDTVETVTDTVETVTDTVETVTDTVETVTDTVREPNPRDIVDLAYKAKFMAIDLGFTPDHLMVDLGSIRDDIIVSGKDEDGKVYEIQLSVTDPSKFPR